MTVSAQPERGPSARSVGSSGDAERRFVIRGVSWDDYVALNDALGVPGLRMWYCEGALELMTTSALHEKLKKIIARLIEFYAFETDLRINGYGSATFRAEAKERGAEPDECYVVGRTLETFPEIVLEVVLTSGGIDKLEVYAGMGVREVWFFEDGAFHLHELESDGYHPIERSKLVPGLDFEMLARFAHIDDQHDAVTALRDWLRGQRR
jgi:Uma2 family endonuclease